LQKYDYPIKGWVQIVKLLNLPYPLDVDPMTQIEVSIVCTERLVCIPKENRGKCYQIIAALVSLKLIQNSK